MSSDETLVNWKIFELQAALIEDVVDPRYMDISREWFTKQHFQDVIEERSTEKKCGYPLCNKPCAGQLFSPVKKGITVAVSNSDDDSFCSNECTRLAREYESSLLDDPPGTRAVAKHLKAPPRQQTNPEIEDLLSTLVGKKDSPEKLQKIVPLHQQGRTDEGQPAEPTSQVEFGPGDEASPAKGGGPRRPPAALPPTDGRLLPSVREKQRREEAEKKRVSFKDSPVEAHSGPDTNSRDNADPAGPKGFMWLDKEDVQSRPQADRTVQVEAAPVEKDLAVEELEDGEVSDPRKSAEIAQWTSSWDDITKSDSPGKYKRPIRRFAPRRAQQRSVQWADDKNDAADPSSVTKEAAVPAAAKPAPVPAERKPVLTQRSKNQSDSDRARLTMQAKIVEREPAPPAPLSQKGLAGANPAEAASSARSAATASAAAVQEANTAGGIEGYMPLMEDIRMAPSTMLKELSFNPLAIPIDEGTREEDERIVRELFGGRGAAEAAPANDQTATEAPNDGGDTETWFVSLWSALEDLFDYECIMSFNEQRGANEPSSMPAEDEVHWSGDEEEDADDDPYLARNTMSGVEAVKRMLLGGIKSAENAVFAKRKLSTTEMNRYIECKARLIAGAALDRSHHFSLSSTQWNLFGVIIVHSVMSRSDLASGMFGAPKPISWRQHINGVMHSLMSNSANRPNDSTRGSKYPLDESELNILCNFFQIEK